MQEKKFLSTLKPIFASLPDVVAVYLFGSYLNEPERARDVDLAILLKTTESRITYYYMHLYSKLGEIFSPLEVDLLFLNCAPVPIAFEVINTGEVIYCTDEERRTDFEYVISGLYLDYNYHLHQGRRELYEAIREASSLVQ
ncbi:MULTISPECIES: type VII toxin-antitoxin system MntA family adenylyltransferase antitoxin [Moorella]|uniref:Nucleotidyltransferase domain protein n=3 Tax=Neomoorella TaxID=44260 RepID=A0A2T0ALT5_9FIRM|nr:nucleotidyltransferase domain-containing protein [Moorella humiferrea]KYH31970.1 nucleotidyltransferase domain protein [Moorella mulderi DSM 14980]PRR69704.1 Nucleotidyltransferase domain protein [Moorella humiferrea]